MVPAQITRMRTRVLMNSVQESVGNESFLPSLIRLLHITVSLWADNIVSLLM